jgi:Tfp pilus assembly protein PilO
MDLSLNRLPWYGQVGAFVVVSGLALFGFWTFYVSDMQADIDTRRARLTTARAEVARGVATARRLPEFQAQVTELEQQLDSLRAVLPEQKDVAEILRRVEGLAIQSNLKIQRFTPQPPRQDAMYMALPIKLQAEGTYHDLAMFFDRISKFHRIINVSDILIKAMPDQQPNATIVAECTATTFVLQEKPAPPAKPGKKPAGAK